MNVIKLTILSPIPAYYTGKVELYAESTSSKPYKSEYYLYGRLHRTDGPAIEFYNGITGELSDFYWYLNGFTLTFEEYFDTLLSISSDEEKNEILFNLDKYLTKTDYEK